MLTGIYLFLARVPKVFDVCNSGYRPSQNDIDKNSQEVREKFYWLGNRADVKIGSSIYRVFKKMSEIIVNAVKTNLDEE